MTAYHNHLLYANQIQERIISCYVLLIRLNSGYYRHLTANFNGVDINAPTDLLRYCYFHFTIAVYVDDINVLTDKNKLAPNFMQNGMPMPMVHNFRHLFQDEFRLTSSLPRKNPRTIF